MSTTSGVAASSDRCLRQDVFKTDEVQLSVAPILGQMFYIGAKLKNITVQAIEFRILPSTGVPADSGGSIDDIAKRNIDQNNNLKVALYVSEESNYEASEVRPETFTLLAETQLIVHPQEPTRALLPAHAFTRPLVMGRLARHTLYMRASSPFMDYTTQPMIAPKDQAFSDTLMVVFAGNGISKDTTEPFPKELDPSQTTIFSGQFFLEYERDLCTSDKPLMVTTELEFQHVVNVTLAASDYNQIEERVNKFVDELLISDPTFSGWATNNKLKMPETSEAVLRQVSGPCPVNTWTTCQYSVAKLSFKHEDTLDETDLLAQAYRKAPEFAKAIEGHFQQAGTIGYLYFGYETVQARYEVTIPGTPDGAIMDEGQVQFFEEQIKEYVNLVTPELQAKVFDVKVDLQQPLGGAEGLKVSGTILGGQIAVLQNADFAGRILGAFQSPEGGELLQANILYARHLPGVMAVNNRHAFFDNLDKSIVANSVSPDDSAGLVDFNPGVCNGCGGLGGGGSGSVSSSGGGEDDDGSIAGMDWWVWLIIGLAALITVLIFCYLGYGSYRKYGGKKKPSDEDGTTDEESDSTEKKKPSDGEDHPQSEGGRKPPVHFIPAHMPHFLSHAPAHMPHFLSYAHPTNTQHPVPTNGQPRNPPPSNMFPFHRNSPAASNMLQRNAPPPPPPSNLFPFHRNAPVPSTTPKPNGPPPTSMHQQQYAPTTVNMQQQENSPPPYSQRMPSSQVSPNRMPAQQQQQQQPPAHRGPRSLSHAPMTAAPAPSARVFEEEAPPVKRASQPLSRAPMSAAHVPSYRVFGEEAQPVRRGPVPPSRPPTAAAHTPSSRVFGEEARPVQRSSQPPSRPPMTAAHVPSAREEARPAQRSPQPPSHPPMTAAHVPSTRVFGEETPPIRRGSVPPSRPPMAAAHDPSSRVFGEEAPPVRRGSVTPSRAPRPAARVPSSRVFGEEAQPVRRGSVPPSRPPMAAAHAPSSRVFGEQAHPVRRGPVLPSRPPMAAAHAPSSRVFGEEAGPVQRSSQPPSRPPMTAARDPSDRVGSEAPPTRRGSVTSTRPPVAAAHDPSYRVFGSEAPPTRRGSVTSTRPPVAAAHDPSYRVFGSEAPPMRRGSVTSTPPTVAADHDPSYRVFGSEATPTRRGSAPYARPPVDAFQEQGIPTSQEQRRSGPAAAEAAPPDSMTSQQQQQQQQKRPPGVNAQSPPRRASERITNTQYQNHSKCHHHKKHAARPDQVQALPPLESPPLLAQRDSNNKSRLLSQESIQLTASDSSLPNITQNNAAYMNGQDSIRVMPESSTSMNGQDSIRISSGSNAYMNGQDSIRVMPESSTYLNGQDSIRVNSASNISIPWMSASTSTMRNIQSNGSNVDASMMPRETSFFGEDPEPPLIAVSRSDSSQGQGQRESSLFAIDPESSSQAASHSGYSSSSIDLVRVTGRRASASYQQKGVVLSMKMPRIGSMMNALLPNDYGGKPSFTRDELKRMHIHDLRQLLPAGSQDEYHVDKFDLVDMLIRVEAIDLVVPYKLSTLESMHVRDLRRCLTEAGVLFDPRFVVEKHDMIRVFKASGKLRILPEDM